MSWTSKVAWKVGLSLRPHPLQQAGPDGGRFLQARRAEPAQRVTIGPSFADDWPDRTLEMWTMSERA
ncbi:MAG: hypothetical protein WA782_09905 [Sulfitobacter sp.]